MDRRILEVRNLRVAYGSHVVIEDVTFEVAVGEILGIMGASGGGKSTILKASIGLYKPQGGEVWFEGRELTRLPERELLKVRPRIGYVFQHGALFDWMTVEENLAYPLERHTRLDEEQIRRFINERLKLVGLEGTNSLYPSQLSGGMLKRAGLLRATMLDPKLVLFDEPTAGLDPLNIQNFVHQIHRVQRLRHLSGVFVSHDALSLLAICDRVAILWDGRFRTIESKESIIKSRDPVVRSFVHPEIEEMRHEQAA